MILNSGKIYREIAAQKDFSFNLNVFNSNISGISEFGIVKNNNQETTLFKFISGDIFDINNKFVWSYNPNEEINISGNITENSINYFINNNPLCLYSPLTSSYYDRFYVETKNSILDFDVIIKGQNPNYIFNFPDSIIDGFPITGSIINTSFPIDRSFKIFSGQIFNNNLIYEFSQLPTEQISGNQSGVIVLTGESLDITFPTINNLQLILFTNFGQINYNLIVNSLPVPIYFHQLITGFTGVLGLEEFNSIEKFYNYKLETISEEDIPLYILVENVSGHTGELIYRNRQVSGTASGIISGFVFDNDNIGGILSGLGFSIDRNNLDYYGNIISGIFSTSFQENIFATGKINYYYNVPILGASGTGKSPEGTIINALGFVDNVNFNNYIFGSGLALHTVPNVRVSGFYFDSLNGAIVNLPVSGISLYTGQISLDYLQYKWSANNLTSSKLTGSSNNIIGILDKEILSTTEEGFYVYNKNIYTDQDFNLIALLPIINPNENNFINSGSAFGSDNVDDPGGIFIKNSTTFISGRTGSITCNLTNYPSQGKRIITHYELSADFTSLFKPQNFELQVSIDQLNWQTLDTRTGVNFYTSPSKIFKCQTAMSPIFNNSYNFIRLNILSGAPWDHKQINPYNVFSGLNIYGFEIYDSTFVERTGINFEKKSLIPTNIDNYVYQGNIFPENSFSGNVTVSQDTISNPGWFAFNSNKNNYPFAEIVENEFGEHYIQYEVNNSLRDLLTGFYIEFDTSTIPQYVKFSASKNGILFTDLYGRINNTDSTININFLGHYVDNYKYFRFSFEPFEEDIDISNRNIEVASLWTNLNNAPIEIDYEDFGEPIPIDFRFTPYSLNYNTNKIYYFDPFLSGKKSIKRSTISNYRNYNSGEGGTDLFTFKQKGPLKIKLGINRPVGGMPTSLLGQPVNRKLLYVVNDKTRNLSIYDTQRNHEFLTGIDLPFIPVDFDIAPDFYNYQASSPWLLDTAFSFNLLGGINHGYILCSGSGKFIDSRQALAYYDNLPFLNSSQVASYGSFISSTPDCDIIVLGGPFDTTTSPTLVSNHGGAAIYTGNYNNGWVLKQKLTGAISGRYGVSAISSDGGIIVLGGSTDSQSTGAALVYTGNARNGWRLRQRLTGDRPFGNYGTNVNVFGSIESESSIILGGNNSLLIYNGTARGGWKLRHKITGFDYGISSISIDQNGRTLCIGSEGDSNTAFENGACYIYTGNQSRGWVQNTVIYGVEDESSFGKSVKISKDGNVLAVGAAYSSSNETLGGYVGFYTKNETGQWIIKNTFYGEVFDNMGFHVNMNDDASVITVGSPGYGINFEQGYLGRVHIYTGNSLRGWSEKQTIEGEEVFQSYNFGINSIINNEGNVLMAGIPYSNDAKIYANLNFIERSGWGLTVVDLDKFEISPYGDFIPFDQSFISGKPLSIKSTARGLYLISENNISIHSSKSYGDIIQPLGYALNGSGQQIKPDIPVFNNTKVMSQPVYADLTSQRLIFIAANNRVLIYDQGSGPILEIILPIDPNSRIVGMDIDYEQYILFILTTSGLYSFFIGSLFEQIDADSNLSTYESSARFVNSSFSYKSPPFINHLYRVDTYRSLTTELITAAGGGNNLLGIRINKVTNKIMISTRGKLLLVDIPNFISNTPLIESFNFPGENIELHLENDGVHFMRYAVTLGLLGALSPGEGSTDVRLSALITPLFLDSWYGYGNYGDDEPNFGGWSSILGVTDESGSTTNTPGISLCPLLDRPNREIIVILAGGIFREYLRLIFGGFFNRENPVNPNFLGCNNSSPEFVTLINGTTILVPNNFGIRGLYETAPFCITNFNNSEIGLCSYFDPVPAAWWNGSPIFLVTSVKDFTIPQGFCSLDDGGTTMNLEILNILGEFIDKYEV